MQYHSSSYHDVDNTGDSKLVENPDVHFSHFTVKKVPCHNSARQMHEVCIQTCVFPPCASFCMPQSRRYRIPSHTRSTFCKNELVMKKILFKGPTALE